MKKKNAGISTVEIVIAAVILAIVVIGVLVAVKMVSKGDDGNENVASADKIISSLADHIQVNVDATDLDVSYFENTLRLVSRDDYQIYYFNKSEGQVYYLSKAYAREMTEEEKITFVSKITISTSGAEVIANNITTFHATISNLAVKDATMTLKVRVVTDTENVNKDVTMRINPNLVAFKDGTYVEPTPTPEGGAEVTPEVMPETTPTPEATPTPEPEKEFTGVLVTKTGSLPIDKLQKAPEGAKLAITLLCEDADGAPKGYGLGGVALDEWNMENSLWQIVSDGEQEVGVEYTYYFPIQQILKVHKDSGAKQIIVNCYNGFKLVQVEVVVEE